MRIFLIHTITLHVFQHELTIFPLNKILFHSNQMRRYRYVDNQNKCDTLFILLPFATKLYDKKFPLPHPRDVNGYLWVQIG